MKGIGAPWVEIIMGIVIVVAIVLFVVFIFTAAGMQIEDARNRAAFSAFLDVSSKTCNKRETSVTSYWKFGYSSIVSETNRPNVAMITYLTQSTIDTLKDTNKVKVSGKENLLECENMKVQDLCLCVMRFSYKDCNIPFAAVFNVIGEKVNGESYSEDFEAIKNWQTVLKDIIENPNSKSTLGSFYFGNIREIKILRCTRMSYTPCMTTFGAETSSFPMTYHVFKGGDNYLVLAFAGNFNLEVLKMEYKKYNEGGAYLKVTPVFNPTAFWKIEKREFSIAQNFNSPRYCLDIPDIEDLKNALATFGNYFKDILKKLVTTPTPVNQMGGMVY